jgi:CarD family transcriptional regulator
MTLRVPTAKIVSVGMRKLAELPIVKRALETLKGRARVTETEAVKEVEAALAKGPRRGPKPAEEEAVVEDEAA